MNKILTIIDGISEWTGKVVCYLIVAIMLIIIYEIILRDIFVQSQPWAHELTCYLFGFSFMLGGAYAFRYGAHVNMDMVVSHLSPRTRAVIDIVTSAMIFLFCGVLVWRSGVTAIEAFRLGFKYQSVWAPPLWPLKGVITLGAALVILQALVKLYRDFQIAIMRKKL